MKTDTAPPPLVMTHFPHTLPVRVTFVSQPPLTLQAQQQCDPFLQLSRSCP